MKDTKIFIAAIPWEAKPANCHDVVWRYSRNPIIRRNQISSSNSIFNSAVVPYQVGFTGVFRCDNRKREMNIHFGVLTSCNGFVYSFGAALLDLERSRVRASFLFRSGHHAVRQSQSACHPDGILACDIFRCK